MYSHLNGQNMWSLFITNLYIYRSTWILTLQKEKQIQEISALSYLQSTHCSCFVLFTGRGQHHLSSVLEHASVTNMMLVDGKIWIKMEKQQQAWEFLPLHLCAPWVDSPERPPRRQGFVLRAASFCGLSWVCYTQVFPRIELKNPDVDMLTVITARGMGVGPLSNRWVGL